jgi:hypothetical protein
MVFSDMSSYDSRLMAKIVSNDPVRYLILDEAACQKGFSLEQRKTPSGDEKTRESGAARKMVAAVIAGAED